MSDKRLKSIAERINRLMDERDGIGADIRDIYAEAKGVGYIPKALRKVIARLRMDPAKLAEDDTLVELYEAALGPVGKAMQAVREGATLDDAAKANGVHRATVARARAVAKSSENATVANHEEIATHDPDTGEITETAPQGFHSPSPPCVDAPGEETSSQPVPDGGVGAGTHSSIPQGDGERGERDGEDQNQNAYRHGPEAQVHRPQRDAADAGKSAAGSGGLRDGQDDAGEDGGRVRGEGAPQGQLSACDPGPIPDFLRAREKVRA